MNYNMSYINIIIAAALISTVKGQFDRGDACERKDYTGTCRIIDECLYARKLVSEYKKPGEPCSFDEDGIKIVCCPNEDLLFRTGFYKSYFERTTNGILSSTDVTCRYDGFVPVICCENKLNDPPPSEPAGCPPLPTPSAVSRGKAWEHCLEYQRYIYWCLNDPNNPEVLNNNRTFICNIPDEAEDRDDDTGPRIAEGEVALPKEFPHMAVLGCHRKNASDDEIEWVGGGSLISDTFILTAAHVLHHNDHGRVRYALLGVNNKSEARDGLLCNVVQWLQHKLYSAGIKQHDIALLKLDRKVLFTEYIRPACLPLPGIAHSNLIVAGWGRTTVFGPTSEILYKTNLYVRGPEECKTTLKGKNFQWDGNSMICAAGTTNREGAPTDSCQGDSGGPLMAIAKGIRCTYIIKGVVSWGPECGKGDPAIYTNVEYYLDWIVGIVWPR